MQPGPRYAWYTLVLKSSTVFAQRLATSGWGLGGPQFQSQPRLTFQSGSRYQLNQLRSNGACISGPSPSRPLAGYQIIDFTVYFTLLAYRMRFRTCSIGCQDVAVSRPVSHHLTEAAVHIQVRYSGWEGVARGPFVPLRQDAIVDARHGTSLSLRRPGIGRTQARRHFLLIAIDTLEFQYFSPRLGRL